MELGFAKLMKVSYTFFLIFILSLFHTLVAVEPCHFVFVILIWGHLFLIDIFRVIVFSQKSKCCCCWCCSCEKSKTKKCAFLARCKKNPTRPAKAHKKPQSLTTTLTFSRLTSNPTFVVRCFFSPTKPHSKKSKY